MNISLHTFTDAVVREVRDFESYWEELCSQDSDPNLRRMSWADWEEQYQAWRDNTNA